MNPQSDGRHRPRMEEIIGQLMASENVCDTRKAVDLTQLLTLSRGRWRDRFGILRMGSTPEGGLAVVCGLEAAGLIWSGDAPVDHGSFICAVSIQNNYPLCVPGVQFLRPVPWCGHVVHKDFLPEASWLPAHLQGYLRQGHGRCCYVRSSQWGSDTGSLAIALWQVSRLVTLTKEHGESGSLNPTARDYALRLGEEGGRLPLGPPLPYPHDDGAEAADTVVVAAAAAPDEDAADIEWIDRKEEPDPDA